MMLEEKYNFVKIFERALRDNWERPAVTDYGTDVTLTYGQLAINIEKLHILFKACGVKKNDKVAVMGRNNSNWVAVYLATVTYGAIIVPILQDFRANDAIHIINHSGSKLLFISDINWEGIDLDQIPKVLAVVSLNDWHPTMRRSRSCSRRSTRMVTGLKMCISTSVVMTKSVRLTIPVVRPVLAKVLSCR